MSLERDNVTIPSGSVNVPPERFTTVSPSSLENEFLARLKNALVCSCDANAPRATVA